MNTVAEARKTEKGYLINIKSTGLIIAARECEDYYVSCSKTKESIYTLINGETEFYATVDLTYFSSPTSDDNATRHTKEMYYARREKDPEYKLPIWVCRVCPNPCFHMFSDCVPITGNSDICMPTDNSLEANWRLERISSSTSIKDLLKL